MSVARSVARSVASPIARSVVGALSGDSVPVIPSIANLTVVSLWQAGYGSSTKLKDAVGGNDLTITSGKQITLVPNTPSGKNAVYFDGTFDLSNLSMVSGAAYGICVFVLPENIDDSLPYCGFGDGVGNYISLGSVGNASQNVTQNGTMQLASTIPASQYHVSAYVQSSTCFIGMNGGVNNGSNPSASRTGFAIGSAFPGSSLRFKGWFFGGFVFTLSTTDFTEITSINRKLSQFYFTQGAVNPSPSGRRQLVIDGNSIAGGSYLPIEQGLPQLLKARLQGWDIYHVGIPGGVLTANTALAPFNIDPNYSSARLRNVAVNIGEPTNYFGIANTAQAYSAMQAWGNGRKAVGYEAVVNTVMPNANHGTTANNDRIALNVLLRADFNVATESPYVFLPAPGVTWADRLIDFDALDTALDITSIEGTPGIHPDFDGSILMARYAARAIDGWNRVAEPEISSPTKRFAIDQSITMTCITPGASIYYTIDGSTPTASSTLYTGAITVSSTTTLKAIGIKTGVTSSDVVTRVYTKVASQYVAANWQATNGAPTITGDRVSFSGQNHNVYSAVVIDATQDFSIIAKSASTAEDAVVVALDTEIGAVSWGDNNAHAAAYFIWGDGGGSTIESITNSGTSSKLVNVTLSANFRVRMRKVDDDALIDTSTDAGVTWTNRYVRTKTFRGLTSIRLKMYSVFPGDTEAWIETLV